MSYIIDIPGGTATLRDADEMTPRHRRASEILLFQAGPLMAKLERSSTVKLPNGQVIEGGDGEGEETLTPDEAELYLQMRNATIFAHLRSWDIDDEHLEKWDIDGSLPTTLDDVWDIPGPIYDALNLAIQRATIAKQGGTSGFADTAENAADDASPLANSRSLPQQSVATKASTSHATSPRKRKSA